MNASKFMDKQIMDLSRSKTTYSNDDFIDLMNPTPANDDDRYGEDYADDYASDSPALTKKEGILPNYDFQPIRPAGLTSRPSDSPPMGGGSGGSGSGSLNAWNSADLKPNSSAARSYGYMGSIEPDKVVLEKAPSVSDAAILSEIDCTMKRYTDNILHAIDGLGAHLSQLESRTRKLEYSVDDLKASIGNNHGGTDGKMRQLENILRELQSSVMDLKDKQDVMNAQIQLEKLQTSEVAQIPETHNTAHISPPQQQTAPAPQQSSQQYPVPSLQSLPPGVSPNAPPPPPSQQNTNPPMQQMPSQYPPASMPPVPQQDTYYPPAGQTQQPPSQQYPAPPPQLQQPQTIPPPPPVQHHQYQPGPPTPYPHGPQQYQQQQQQPSPAINSPQPPQLQPPMGHHSEEPHLPSQTYPPSLRQPTSGPPPSQQFYNTPPSHMYDSPTGRSGSGFSSSVYNPPNGPSEPLPYSGSSSHYSNNPGTKYPSLSSGSNYPQLPTARVLPQVIPSATPVSSGASSGGSGNRVPIDDVIDKVTNMGFSREQVKGTVRKLTENGQPVDLNIVLDKLMNDGDVQQPRGWFGR